jgi:hypothetical protein
MGRKEGEAMANKKLFSLAVGMLVVTLAGASAATEYLAMSAPSSEFIESSADPDTDRAKDESWRPQEHSETGAILGRMQESDTVPRQPTEPGLAVESDGTVRFRPGIDDGP